VGVEQRRFGLVRSSEREQAGAQTRQNHAETEVRLPPDLADRRNGGRQERSGLGVPASAHVASREAIDGVDRVGMVVAGAPPAGLVDSLRERQRLGLAAPLLVEIRQVAAHPVRRRLVAAPLALEDRQGREVLALGLLGAPGLIVEPGQPPDS
jgi:hypothetical protein